MINNIADNQLLDILFDCNGVDLCIKEIESHLTDLTETRQKKIRHDLLVLRCYVMDIRKTIGEVKPENFKDEDVIKHSTEKSKTLVSDMRKLIDKPIIIKPEV